MEHPLLRERLMMRYPSSWRQYCAAAAGEAAGPPQEMYSCCRSSDRLAAVKQQRYYLTPAAAAAAGNRGLSSNTDAAALMRPASSSNPPLHSDTYCRAATAAVVVDSSGVSFVPTGVSTATTPATTAAGDSAAAYDYRERLQLLMARHQQQQQQQQLRLQLHQQHLQLQQQQQQLQLQQQQELLRGDCCTTSNSDGSRTTGGTLGCSLTVSPRGDLQQQQRLRVAAEPREAPLFVQQESPAAWTQQQQLRREQQQQQEQRVCHHLHAPHVYYESERRRLYPHWRGTPQAEEKTTQQLQPQQRCYLGEGQQQQVWGGAGSTYWSGAEEGSCLYVQPGDSVAASDYFCSPAVTQEDYCGAATANESSSSSSSFHWTTPLYATEPCLPRSSGCYSSAAAATDSRECIEGTKTSAYGFRPSEDPTRRRRRPSADADAAGGAAGATAAASEAAAQQLVQRSLAGSSSTAGYISRVGEGPAADAGLEKEDSQTQEQQLLHARGQKQQQGQQQMFVTPHSCSSSFSKGPTSSTPVAAEESSTLRQRAGGGCPQSISVPQQQQQRPAAEAQQQLLQFRQAASSRSSSAQRRYPLHATTPPGAAAGGSCWPLSCAGGATAEDAEAVLLQQRPPPPGADTLVDLDEQLRQQQQQGLSIPRLPSFVSVVSPTQRAAALREECLSGASFSTAGPYMGRLQQRQQLQQQAGLPVQTQERVRVVPYEEYLRTHVQHAAAAAGDGQTSRPPSGRSSSSVLLQQQQLRGRNSSKASRTPKKKAVIVGCNYHVTQQYHLQGPANDAHLFAHACVETLGFLPHNICLLCDHLPSSCYRVGGAAGLATTAAAAGRGGEAAAEGQKKEVPAATAAGEKKKGAAAGAEPRGAQQQQQQQQQHGKAGSPSLWGEHRSRSAGELLLQGDVKQAAAAAADAAAAGIASFWGGLGDASSRPAAGKSGAGGARGGPVVHSIVDVEKIEPTEENPFMNELPTRQNILKALNWLVRDAKSDDHLIFYYSGHSVQVDNMAGWEGEGYEEAIVPCDFDMQDIRDGQNCSLLTMVQLRQLLLSIPAKTHLTIVLDCCGGQTILDPAGTLSPWTFIKGVKQRGLWPLATDATDKMHRAVYRREVWADPDMQKQLVRPRYMPGVEVQSVAALVDPLYEAPLNCRQNFVYKAFCLAGAPWGTCGVEAIFPSIVVPRLWSSPGAGSLPAFSSKAGASVIHGVFTWSLVTALVETMTSEPLLAQSSCGRFAVDKGAPAVAAAAAPWAPTRLVVTYKRLLERTRRVVSDLKWNRLFKLDQHPDLTIHTGGGAHVTDAFCSLSRQQQQQRESPFTCRGSSACVGIAAAASSASTRLQQQQDLGAPERAGPGVIEGIPAAATEAAAMSSSARDVQQQQQTGRAYPFISAESAWQQVTEASLRDAADRKDGISFHLPYTAADCYRRAFPSATPAAAAASAVAVSDAAVPRAYVPAGGQGQQQAATAAAVPVLQTQQLLQFHPGSAPPPYISMQQQLQQQQRALHQQWLQQQVQLGEQQSRVHHGQMQWHQQQQKQCVIARLSPAAGEQLLWKDFSTVVYV